LHGGLVVFDRRTSGAGVREHGIVEGGIDDDIIATVDGDLVSGLGGVKKSWILGMGKNAFKPRPMY